MDRIDVCLSARQLHALAARMPVDLLMSFKLKIKLPERSIVSTSELNDDKQFRSGRFSTSG
jgi:hypothetical protein